MVSEEMRRCREKGYDKWMDLAKYIWKLVELPGTYREDLTIILVFHMKRSIVIDGQEVAFRASAAIPCIYRMRFHRDIFKDLRIWKKGLVRTIRKTPVWICSLLRCLRTSPM